MEYLSPLLIKGQFEADSEGVSVSFFLSFFLSFFFFFFSVTEVVFVRRVNRLKSFSVLVSIGVRESLISSPYIGQIELRDCDMMYIV